MLDAHDDFHRVGYHGPNRVGPRRSEAADYSVTFHVHDGKAYLHDDYTDEPEDVAFKDGVYQPITTGLETPEDERAGGPSLTPSGTPIDLKDEELERGE